MEHCEQPGWSTAVASGDRSLAGLVPHVQRLPSGVLTVVAPSRPTEATVGVREASARFVPLLAGLSDYAEGQLATVPALEAETGLRRGRVELMLKQLAVDGVVERVDGDFDSLT